MGFSIQDYLKKINSSLKLLDCVSLLVTMVFLISLTVGLYLDKKTSSLPVSYTRDDSSSLLEKTDESRPFGSKNGKTYTFSWCIRSTAIREENKVYYMSEEDAKSSGRRLSKLCQK